MADVHDKATRSKNMRAIATRNTAIEKRLASVLNELGIPYRVQDASLPGANLILLLMIISALYLPMAVSGTSIIVTCLKFRRHARRSGWKRLAKMLSVIVVTSAFAGAWLASVDRLGVCVAGARKTQ